MDALAALIERVEKLEGAPAPHEALPDGLVSLTHTVFGASWVQDCLFRALRGSLDAAVAFTEALLPEGRWGVKQYPHAPEMFEAYVVPPGDTGWGAIDATAPTPALALVLAALKAYQEKEKG